MPPSRTVAFEKNAVNVFFHILTRCNLRCRHCYINPREHGREMLPAETIHRWLEVLAERRRRANVIFLGGEPTLHPDLPAAVRSARALGYISVTIDTNGYLFHDVLTRLGPDDVDYFSFSLDGASAAVNDAIRGPGSFAACTDGIRRAVARGFRASLIYTVSRFNLHELEDMPALLESLGVKRFFIQVIGIRGQSADEAPDRWQVSRRQWLEKVPEAAAAAARLGITATFPRVFLGPGETFACAGNVADNLFIFPNGRVYRCPLCEDHPLHSLVFEDDRLLERPGITERELFRLRIPEGCVMNRLIQPANLEYDSRGRPRHRIACCLLKEEVAGR